MTIDDTTSYSELECSTTIDYLKSIIAKGKIPSPHEVEAELINRIADATNAFNNYMKRKHGSFHQPIRYNLSETQLAMILVYLHGVSRIAMQGLTQKKAEDVIGIYCNDPNDQSYGLYCLDPMGLYVVASSYSSAFSSKQIQTLNMKLHEIAPRRSATIDRNLVAVNNGIFDYKSKKLIPFSPEYVFLTKSYVDYNPNAVNPHIHNTEDDSDWDLDSWLLDLVRNNEKMNLLMWQLIGGILRNNNTWDKAIFLYCPEGSNGKGTFCELLRNVIGAANAATIPIANFSSRFALGDLGESKAIITDENGTSNYISDAANFKAIATNDPVSIEKKGQQAYTYRFRGLMIQCINGLPMSSDKTPSFYRRFLYVPLDRHFLGHERKYIKYDYMQRKEVLEYALYKSLTLIPNYYTFIQPECTFTILEKAKIANERTRQFWFDVKDSFKWELIPSKLMYDLYRAWFTNYVPNGRALSLAEFTEEMTGVLARTDADYVLSDRQFSTSAHCVGPEPLIGTYHLEKWMTPGYSGTNIDKMSCPDLPRVARGYVLKEIIEEEKEQTS